jgi:hypothetical protein
MTEYFIHRYAKRLGKRIRRVTKETSYPAIQYTLSLLPVLAESIHR